jgi:hypothetical protein
MLASRNPKEPAMSNLTREHVPGTLSMIGGAAQGGSAKPKQEREQLDREHGLEEDKPAGAGESGSTGTVGGNSNDNRSDDERSAQTPDDGRS